MNIRKRLAVTAAIVLPVSGLAVVGGVSQFASAGGPPVLSCASLGADAGPTGGVTFDTGSGPGTAGLDLGASLQQAPATTLDVDALATGGNVVVLEAEAIAGQTLSLANGQTVTVLGDSVAHTGVAGPKNLETAIISPNPGTPIAKKMNVTINPSTTGTYNTYNNATVTSGSAIVTATGADFTGDVGMPVTVSYLDTTSPNNGYFSPFSPPPPATQNSPATEYSFISAVGGGGDTATISEQESPGATTTSATESLNSQVSASVVVTVGSTAQTTGTVGTDYDFALTGCQSSIHADPGQIYPNNVTLTNTGPVSNPSAAVALEAGVKPITGADINYPGGLPSGYTWGDAVNPTNFVAGGDGGFSNVTWNSLKDTLNLSTDQETFVGGTVSNGPFAFAKASMVFGVGSMVVCTEAQLEGIGTGSGGSGIDVAAGPHHVAAASSASDVGTEVLKYCDGGSLSSVTPGNAFNELAVVEADRKSVV